VAIKAKHEPANKARDSNFIQIVVEFSMATKDKSNAKDAIHFVHEAKQPTPTPIYPEGVDAIQTDAKMQHSTEIFLPNII